MQPYVASIVDMLCVVAHSKMGYERNTYSVANIVFHGAWEPVPAANELLLKNALVTDSCSML